MSPAQVASIEVGDRIVAVNDQAVDEWDTFVLAVQSRPGELVTLDVSRDGQLITIETTLATHPESGLGFLGIRPEPIIVHETASLPMAAWRAIADVGTALADSVYGIWSLFSNLDELVDRIISPPGDPSANENLSTRPLGIYGLGRILSFDIFDWSDRFRLFGLVNVFVGTFNMLPVPPFDGGHMAVATYERWRERGGRGRYLIDPRKLTPIATFVAGFLILLAFGLLYLDIANPIDL